MITYRTAQGRAQRAGLRLTKRGPTYTLYDADNQVIAAGDLPSVLAHMPDRRKYQAIGKPSPAWQQLIDDYITVMTAADRPATIYLRSFHLAKMAREIGGNPTELTADQLVAWFSGQQWGTETRRSYCATVRGFLRWAYRTKRIPVDLTDELPHVRVHRGPPRPTPDQVWHQARTDADPRVQLMLRLAAEAGLRRGEIARIHSRDLLPGTAGPQLLVHGKGGKQRIVPISDPLAATIKAQAPHDGWLFPSQTGGHLSAPWVGKLCSDALGEQWSLHTLRHRYATRAYRGTRNLRAVQLLLGHESIATTERYTAVDDSETRAAMTAALDDAI